jgi:hypothetical protein
MQPIDPGHWVFGPYWLVMRTVRLFHGWVGDIRIVNRPLSVDEFMIAR